MSDTNNTIKERCLTFKYAGKEKIEKSKMLADLLKQNNIDFACYLEKNDYYPCQFTVRRCGKKWNDILKLINSVKPAKYKYKQIDFYIINETRGNFLIEVLGNIQEVIYCN